MEREEPKMELEEREREMKNIVAKFGDAQHRDFSNKLDSF